MEKNKIKKQREVLFNLKIEWSNRFLKKFLPNIRKEFLKEYKNKVIGIFAHYDSIFKGIDGTSKGDKLIEQLANKFANLGFVAFTGEFVYKKTGGKVIKEKSIHKKIDTHKEKLFSKDLNKCYGRIPNYAIFLLSKERSSSQFEEEGFHENIFGGGELGVGFHITKNKPRGCEFINTQLMEMGKEYHLCEPLQHRSCVSNEKECFIRKEIGIPHSNIEIFLDSPNMELIILNSFNLIPEVMICRIKAVG